MTINEQIVLIARETGWSLDYIRALSFFQFSALVAELLYQRSLESYEGAYNAALIICTLASDKRHHYRPEEVIGSAPERRVMTGNNLAKPAKLDKMVLADGKEYELAPLTANIMADLEDKFEKSIDELFSGAIRMKVFRALVYERLRAKYPELTEEQVGDLLTADVIIASRKQIGV